MQKPNDYSQDFAAGKQGNIFAPSGTPSLLSEGWVQGKNAREFEKAVRASNSKPTVFINTKKMKDDKLKAKREKLIRANLKQRIQRLPDKLKLLSYYLEKSSALNRTKNVIKLILHPTVEQQSQLDTMSPRELAAAIGHALDNESLLKSLLESNDETRQIFIQWDKDLNTFCSKTYHQKKWDLVQLQIGRLRDNLDVYRKNGVYASFMDDPINIWDARKIFTNLFTKGDHQSDKIIGFNAQKIAVALKKVVASGKLEEKIFYTDEKTREQFLEFCSRLNIAAEQHARRQHWIARKKSLKKGYAKTKQTARKIAWPITALINTGIIMGGFTALVLWASDNQGEPQTPLKLPSDNAQPIAPDMAVQNFTHYVDTRTDPLTVRDEPNVNATITGRISRGECVTVSGTARQGWATIDMPNGQTNYVASRYLSPVSPQTNCPN